MIFCYYRAAAICYCLFERNTGGKLSRSSANTEIFCEVHLWRSTLCASSFCFLTKQVVILKVFFKFLHDNMSVGQLSFNILLNYLCMKVYNFVVV